MAEISVTSTSVVEGDYIRFTLQLSEAEIDPVTATYRTLLDTAKDSDLYGSYVGNYNGTVTFPPGETSIDITVRSNFDNREERDEAVVLELSNASSNATFAGGEPVLRTTGIILDDDGTGSDLSIFVSDPILVEGDGGTEAVFELRLSRPAENDFSVSYETQDITAIAGEDYTARSGVANFRAGQSVTTVSVSVSGDDLNENAERFALVVSEPDSPTLGQDGLVGIATVLDDDDFLPEVSIEGNAVEEGSSLRYVVRLSEPATDAVTVSYRTLNGTSENGDLYGSFNSYTGSVTFAPGETSAEIFVRSNYDNEDERDETVIVELFNISENAALSNGQNTLRAGGAIIDDDGVGSNLELFVSNPTLAEGDSGRTDAVFTITLSQPAPAEFSVNYRTKDTTATAGVDYAETQGRLTFVAGQSEAAVSVPIFGDRSAESAEQFSLILDTPQGVSIGTDGIVGVATLSDDDTGAERSFSVDGDAVIEGNYLKFIVSLSEPAPFGASVKYQTVLGTALDDDLYGASTSNSYNGTLTFEPGETSKVVYVRSSSDNTDERDESIFLRLYDPENAALAGGGDSLFATGAILDNDGEGLNIALLTPPTIVREPGRGALEVAVPVKLSRPATSDMSFDVSVTGGSATGQDFDLLTSRISFGPGETTGAVRLVLNSDNLSEGRETIQLNYSPVAGTPYAGSIPDQSVTLLNASSRPGYGDDYLVGSNGGERTDLLSGNDVFNGRGGNDFIVGGEGDDDLTGGTGNDSIYAGAGDTGDDRLSGQNGRDILGGGEGNDTIYGNGGNDTLFGGDGSDRIFGGDGRDVAWSGAQNDRIYGGADDDVFGGGDGNDAIYGGSGNDTLYGGADNGNDTIDGNAGNDLVYGGGGNDQIDGSNGSDLLFNGAGQDVVRGGAGADTIWGGAGNDRMTGGGDADTFAFVSGNGSDRITDFEDGFDIIEIAQGAESFSDLEISNVGGNAHISFEDVVIVVEGLTSGSLSADDFVFS